MHTFLIYPRCLIRRTLASHLSLLHRESLANNGNCGQVTAALDAVNRIGKITDIYTRLKPFRVLGIVAQSGLTASILTTVVSFYTTIFGLYTQATNAQGPVA